jgi:hypothetical protein
VANNDSYTLAEDTSVSGNVLTNDTDIDSTGLTAGVLTGPTHGTLNLNADGTFTYTVSDGTSTTTATVSINVTAVNDAPVAVTDTLTAVTRPIILVGLEAYLPAGTSVIGNDYDVDGDTFTVELVGSPPLLATSFNLSSTGIVTFTTLSLGIPVSFSYRIKDSKGAYSDPVTVKINIPLL